MNKLTLDEIAKLAGVSRSTVSRVVNNHPSVSDEVRERVLQLIAKTGFQPNAAARSLAVQRSNMLGLVIPQTVRSIFSDPYFPRLTEGVAEACDQHDYTLSLFIEHEEGKLLSRITRQGWMDGLIVQTSTLTDSLIPSLVAAKVPLVAMGHPVNAPDASYIDVDNVSGAYMAVAHLIQLGRKRIATISGPLNTQTGIDRMNGYKRALEARGLEVDPALVVEGDFTEAGSYYGARQLLPARPDAIFAASDVMARGAIRALNESGLAVPGDVSIVGYDDLPPATLAPPLLTTVRQPIRRLGIKAVETLLDIIEHGLEPPRRFIFDTELVIRQSCGSI